MATTTQLKWDIWTETQKLDNLSELFYLERITVDADTNSQNLVLEVGFGAANTTQSTNINSAARENLTTSWDLLGPINHLILDGDFESQTGIKIYNIAVDLRPLPLQLSVLGKQQNISINGRASLPEEVLRWDIWDHQLPEDARHVNPIIRRLWVDCVSSVNSISMGYLLDDDTAVEQTAFTQATRGIVIWDRMIAGRVKQVFLCGDFTVATTSVYGIGMDIYIPRRQV
jgi:hypothetical protein